MQQPWFLKIFATFCFAFLAVSVAATAQEAQGFTDDIDAGIKSARDSQRDLFLLFTGSDWCPPCRKLEAEILEQVEFLQAANKDFVLVKIDFPRNPPLPEAQAARNEEWSRKYGISQFPTIAVVDRDLRPIGFLGYAEGGPQPFLNSLNELRNKRIRRDDALAKAARAASDEERARFLDAALSELDLDIVNLYYTAERDQIGEIDADNRLKFREKYFAEQDAELRKLVMADVMAISQMDRPERAIAFIDEVIREIPLPVDQKFQILQIKLQLLQKVKQYQAAEALLNELLELEGVSPELRERLQVKKVLQYVAAGDGDKALSYLQQALAEPGDHLLLKLTRGQILASQGKVADALKVFDEALARARFRPFVMIELVGAKADLLVKEGREEEALRVLDNLADDPQMPIDLRCEALLHQAMIMRNAGRVRPAMLTENRAIELADSPPLKREMQKVVDSLRSQKKD